MSEQDEVRRGQSPKWLARVILDAKSYLARHYHGWTDHFGVKIDKDGRELLVAEPYGLRNDGLSALVELATSTGCSVSIVGVGSWNNGTIRIVVAPPPHHDDVRYMRQESTCSIDKDAVVYGMKDPRDGLFYYVGQTTDLGERIRQHLSLSPYDGSQEKREWIRSLSANGAEPVVEVLEECGIYECRTREREWIIKLRMQGHPLANREYGRMATTAPAEWIRLADSLKTIRSMLMRASSDTGNISGKSPALRCIHTAVQKLDQARCRLDGELFRLTKGCEAGIADVFYGE